jgi:hypothetical protein
MRAKEETRLENEKQKVAREAKLRSEEIGTKKEDSKRNKSPSKATAVQDLQINGM